MTENDNSIQKEWEFKLLKFIVEIFSMALVALAIYGYKTDQIDLPLLITSVIILFFSNRILKLF